VTTRLGGCQCGQIRYRLESEPLAVTLCHCSHCRKQSGSNQALNWVVLSDNLTIEGALKSFPDTGDSGHPVMRDFCPDCGSPIRSLPEVLPGKTVLKAGTLDLVPEIPPTAEAYCVSLAAWEKTPPSMVRFPGGRTA
jgi:hypothetical protein